MQPWFIAAALTLGISPVLAQQQHTMVTLNQDEVTWKAAPPVLPKGAEMSVLYGDPTKEGVFVMRLKFPANYKVQPHTHPVDEIVTVISGDFNIGAGHQFDPTKTKAILQGGVIAMSPGMQHFVHTTQGTVVQISTRGPWTLNYVNAADDPRKSQ
jgi:quercetin dioxygenase-like cupin family protein